MRGDLAVVLRVDVLLFAAARVAVLFVADERGLLAAPDARDDFRAPEARLEPVADLARDDADVPELLERAEVLRDELARADVERALVERFAAVPLEDLRVVEDVPERRVLPALVDVELARGDSLGDHLPDITR